MDILGFEKLVFHPEKVLSLKNGEPQFPIHATLSLGNYCNHKCLWCTAYEYQLDKANLIKKEELIKWLSTSVEYGLKAVGYVGNGEPTAHPDFREITNEVHLLGLEQGIFTNGYLLDRYEDEILNYFRYLRISLDAGSSEVHAKLHDVRENHYPKIMKNLESILEKRKDKTPTIGIQYATHQDNIVDLQSCCQKASEMGIDYFSIKPVFNRGPVGNKIEKNNLKGDDVRRIVNELRVKYENKNFKIYYRDFQFETEESDKNTLHYDKCVAGYFNLNVYEDKKIIYCGPHRVAVGTMNDDHEVLIDRINKLSNKLDLSKCPGGCRYHAMNRLAHLAMNPEEAGEYHINFL